MDGHTDPNAGLTVAVFGASRSEPGDGVWKSGERLGKLLVERGYRVATGGYEGLMEAVSKGAKEAGGHVIGVTAPDVFPHRPGGNMYLTQETRAVSLAERIHELIDVADASIALPGSIGTLTEIMMAWNLAFVARYAGRRPDPLVTVGDTWRSIIDDLTKLLNTDGSLVICVDTVDEAAVAVHHAFGRG